MAMGEGSFLGRSSCLPVRVWAGLGAIPFPRLGIHWAFFSFFSRQEARIDGLERGGTSGEFHTGGGGTSSETREKDALGVVETEV